MTAGSCSSHPRQLVASVSRSDPSLLLYLSRSVGFEPQKTASIMSSRTSSVALRPSFVSMSLSSARPPRKTFPIAHRMERPSIHVLLQLDAELGARSRRLGSFEPNPDELGLRHPSFPRAAFLAAASA